MKPASIRAESARRAEVQARKLARAIPDNAKLVNILAQLEKPLRRDFYHRFKPYLKFVPVPLETINELFG